MCKALVTHTRFLVAPPKFDTPTETAKSDTFAQAVAPSSRCQNFGSDSAALAACSLKPWLRVLEVTVPLWQHVRSGNWLLSICILYQVFPEMR